jgi:hypothetical protein
LMVVDRTGPGRKALWALYDSKSLDMGKAQKKTGKGRLDKYYKLAKYA